ncbi:MAG: putative manganese-dependent inorganic diphosphatase [Desulfuromonadaceae bacterium]|nr:putative manganese-dependent inorganic diphosphatase [Desulfuromonadaceae bacterium]
MRKETIYVIGHCNPDTDSICSAMAYARLRQRQGCAEVHAARAGILNRQTEFVLNELGLTAPRLLNDVYPRIEDVITDRVVTITADTPLSQALEMFHQHDIRQLPVIDDDGRPLGLLILKRVTEHILVSGIEAEIRRVNASPDSIRACLRAQLLTGHQTEKIEKLELYVGAMAAATFHQKMQTLDPRNMIVITGDRQNIQQQCIDIGVRILVVTGGLPVAAALIEQGQKNRVTILSTPLDSATSAWLTRLSTPVGQVIESQPTTVTLTDRVDDLRLKLMHGRDPGAIVLNRDGRVVGMATKSNLLGPSPVKLILVDHNELSQAVPGADKVEVLEVIDHHRLGNFHTDLPIRFINQPLGSTCTIVAGLYRQANIVPEPVYAGLLLAGLLSDTVILKSPTTTDSDRELSQWLGELSGLEVAEFGRRLFQSGSTLAAYPTRQALILSDFKEFTTGSTTFGIGQIEVVSFQEFHELRDEIEVALNEIKEIKQLDMIGLLVTDIVKGTSLLLALGTKELPLIIGYPLLDRNLYELKGVLSRKKQLVPQLLKMIKS